MHRLFSVPPVYRAIIVVSGKVYQNMHLLIINSKDGVSGNGTSVGGRVVNGRVGKEGCEGGERMGDVWSVQHECCHCFELPFSFHSDEW